MVGVFVYHFPRLTARRRTGRVGLGRVDMTCAMWRRVLSNNGTLCKLEQQKRNMFFCFFAASAVLPLADLMLWFSFDSRRYIYLGGLLGAIVASLVAIISCGCRWPLPKPYVVCLLYAISVAIITFDFDARTLGFTAWPLLVLVLDLLLVAQVDEKYSTSLVFLTVVWLTALGLEESYRPGFFDIPGSSLQDGVWGRKEAFRKLTECEAPPCPTELFPPANLSVSVGVFVLDFIMTRGFSRDAKEKQESMRRTIVTVQEIATLLAGYDVQRVADMLDTHGSELPDKMTTALRALEQNLRVYKAYLPKTCLPFDDDAQENSVTSFSVEASSFDDVSSMGTSPPCARLSPPLCLLSVKATLLTVNIKNTLRRLDEDSVCFSQLFTTLLLETLRATDLRRGMVDVFVGDRIHCSFNASKQCMSHATSALHTASFLIRNRLEVGACEVNVGIATGNVLRGDMGCEIMRRFSMVGTLVRNVHGMERAGRMFGCDVICNRLCFSDAECEHDLRLIPCKVEMASTCEAEVVAELVVPQGEPTGTVVGEWMYQVGEKKDWEEYNLVVRQYLKGAVSADAVNTAASRASLAATPVCVRACSYKDNVLYLTCPTGKLVS